MKKPFYFTALIFICFVFIAIISCKKDNSNIFFTEIDTHHTSEHVIQSIPPGIYKGEATILNNGIAYSWLEFKEVDVLDKVGIVLPIKDLDKLFSFSGGSKNVGNIDISMPNINRCIAIFNKIVVNYTSTGPNTGFLGKPHFNFNFHLNGSSFNPKFDCNAHHADYNMPAGYSPVSSNDGCIMGLGLLWLPNDESFENKEADILLGSANAELAFYSPSASMELLTNHPDINGSIPLPPPTMKASSLYPTYYSIKQVGNDLWVTLEKFAQKN